MKLFILAVISTFSISSFSENLSDYQVYAASYDLDSCKVVISDYHWSKSQDKSLGDSFVAQGAGKVCNQLKEKMTEFSEKATTKKGLRYNKNNHVHRPVFGFEVNDVQSVPGLKVIVQVSTRSGLE